MVKPSGILVHALLIHVLCSIASSSSSSPTVIVIGAGMSGIAAAKTLHEAGIQDILILEATPRIGGRLKKTQFSGYAVEMGANWISGGGPVVNPILEMAKKLKLKIYYNDYTNMSSNTYKQEGGLYPQKMVKAVEETAEATEEFFLELEKSISTQPGKDEDVSILGAQRMFKHVPTSPLEMVIDYSRNDYDSAEPPQISSLKHSYPDPELEDHGEDPYFVADPRGFELIVQHLANQFLSSLTRDPRLKLNQAVREINYSDNEVTIKTEGGSVYQAKYAIVSVSLGVLQSDLINFKPELPLWKQVAISNYDMTIYTKIFLKFPSKFWPTGKGTEFFLYAHERRGYYPVWQHLENEYPGSNILMVTVTADESRRIEQLPDARVEAEVMDVLRRMFGKDIPKPENILVPRWGSDKFYRGSYSNWPNGYSTQRHKELGETVGPVYFTGEHVHNKYMGYVTSAYFAGIGTAKELIRCIKNQSCKGHHHKFLWKDGRI